MKEVEELEELGEAGIKEVEVTLSSPAFMARL
jgi:hypothetical protein